MWAETIQGQGTRVHFNWPLVNGPKTRTLQAQSDWGELKQKPLQFLVVDDDPVNLVVVSSQIRKHMPQATVHTANQTSVALDKLSESSFDVLILDMFMPDLGGQELARRVRETGNPHEGVLILALTASSNPDDWRVCLQAGMNGVLVKPFEINELLNAIHHHSQFQSGDLS
jgi:CheY-like chemotaxis protein